MKIAQVCPTYYPSLGGVESHVQAISERLVEKGFETDVLTTDSTGNLPKQETLNGVRILRFSSWAPSNAYHFSRELKTYLMESSSNYEVIHAHSYHAMPALYASQSKAGNKLVFAPHYHGTGHTLFRRLLHIPWKYYARQIFKKSDCIICVSNFERDLLIKNFGLEPRKVVFVPDGLNLQEFEVAARDKAADLDKFRILCVSRLEKYKGIQYLLRCLAGLESNFALEVVGRGPYKRSLEREAVKLGVSSRVQFFEGVSREELLTRYRNASVFVLLSKYEAFGIVVAEALASGLPCIVSRTSALAEWIDNKSCFGVDYPINLQKLSDVVTKIARLPPIKRDRIMDWNEAADKITRFYNALVRTGSPSGKS